MLLSTTLCYLLHHSSQQHGPKGKAMFFMKILLARSGVAKYNLVIFWHYWENGHFNKIKSLHKHYQYEKAFSPGILVNIMQSYPWFYNQ